jgi:flagellar protein FliL
MAGKAGQDAKAKPGGLMPFLAVTLLLAGAAGGGGHFLIKHAMEVARTSAEAEAEAGKTLLAPEVTGTRHAITLKPIIANLATPQAWLRLEAAIIVDDAEGKPPQALELQITEDILAYARTVTIGHLAGPAGFVHFKADITERAKTRSGGLVKDVLLLSMVME